MFVICLPILLALVLAVRCLIGSPIFFRQVRPGRNEELFEMVKFRTMTDARDASGELLEDAERMTRFGTFLRSTSLDELPEFWNVLKGEMSLVGPRPLLVEYLPLYNDRQKKRHEVRPGLTGLAQVNGRNACEWDDRLEMDAWYVDNRSLLLDCRIILMTIIKVLRRDGISDGTHVTKERFRGTAH